MDGATKLRGSVTKSGILAMPSLRTQAERRIYPRHRVRVGVLWLDRQQAPMTGEICDVTAHGVFLVATSALPDDVRAGDLTRITVPTGLGNENLAGIVRWRGYHPKHESIGCGIQLDEDSLAVVAKLFPSLRSE
jgi:hypothetical protein